MNPVRRRLILAVFSLVGTASAAAAQGGGAKPHDVVELAEDGWMAANELDDDAEPSSGGLIEDLFPNYAAARAKDRARHPHRRGQR